MLPLKRTDSRKRGKGVISGVVALHLYEGIWLTSWDLGQKYTNIGEQVHPYLVPTAEVLLRQIGATLGRGLSATFAKIVFPRVLS